MHKYSRELVLPLYYKQAQAEYKSTTVTPLRPFAYRSGLARVRA